VVDARRTVQAGRVEAGEGPESLATSRVGQIVCIRQAAQIRTRVRVRTRVRTHQRGQGRTANFRV
jgi:hypothetical protein